MIGPAKRQPLPFGKYLLLDRINIGGMAEVWRGKAFGTGGFERLVAIKRILPNIAEDDEFVAMFIDEAKICVQLSHPNIAQIYDLGQESGTYFIAMEYVPGKDLRALFDRCRKKGEKAPVALTCHVIAHVCDGLDHAHKKRDAVGKPMHVVHRDVSPQNVLISFDGEVKVIDFGIAKAAGKATRTQAGVLKGKFGYMSPEQVRGVEIDHRADIFAIGICLYELLTGERLFVAETDFAVLEKVRDAVVPSPSAANPAIPPELEAIVRKVLSGDLETRYQSASALAEDLRRFMEDAKLDFSAAELGEFMRGLFADEVERESQRLKDYAEIVPPEGFLKAATRPVLPRRTSAPAAPPPEPAALGEDEEEEDGATLLIGEGVVAAALAPQPGDEDEEEITATTLSNPRLAPGIPVLVPLPSGAAPAGEDPPTTRGRRLDLAATPPLPNDVADSSTDADGTGPVVLPPNHGVPPALLSPPDASAAPPRSSPARAERPAEAPAPRARPSPSRPRGGSRTAVPLQGRAAWVVGIAALLIVGVVAAVWAGHEPAKGYVLIDVPEGARAIARLSLNGKPVPGPLRWPVLRQLPVGQAMVMVSADGYRPFVAPVEVAESDEPTPVRVTLAPKDARARLVVDTDPLGAEIRVDGTLVRPEGKTVFSPTPIPVGRAVRLEVKARGFEPFRGEVTATEPGAAVTRSVKLRPIQLVLEVSSMPAGAQVLLGGRSLGTTPAKLKVAPDTHAITVRKRCYAEKSLAVPPPAVPGAAVSLHADLERSPDCR